MAGFQLLDVVIGLVFVYLSLSLICSGINEWIARHLDSRATNLWNWLEAFIKDDQLTAFKDHVLIKGLTQPADQFKSKTGTALLNRYVDWLSAPGKKPSYISPHTFALVLFDIINSGKPNDPNQPLASLKANVNTLPESDMRKTLLALIDDSGNNIEKVRQNIEGWFNDSMERLSGWYKRRTQVVIFALAIGVSIAMNVDSIRLANSLYRDATLRAATVAAAQNAVAQQNNTTGDQAKQTLEQLNLPIGWADPQIPAVDDPLGWLFKVVGLLLTAFAVSQGAPFWFDTLNRLVNIRSTGDPPSTEPKK